MADTSLLAPKLTAIRRNVGASERELSAIPTGLRFFSPGLAQQRLPWVGFPKEQPGKGWIKDNRLLVQIRFNSFRVGKLVKPTQGSSFLATLG